MWPTPVFAAPPPPLLYDKSLVCFEWTGLKVCFSLNSFLSVIFAAYIDEYINRDGNKLIYIYIVLNTKVSTTLNNILQVHILALKYVVHCHD
jgi:hypothetical protein